MNSRTTKRFRQAFARLPEPIRKQAREAYRMFCQNPNHPGLRFKLVHSTEPIYSTRITREYRALGVRTGDKIVWFWIGSHSDYGQLLKQI